MYNLFIVLLLSLSVDERANTLFAAVGLRGKNMFRNYFARAHLCVHAVVPIADEQKIDG